MSSSYGKVVQAMAPNSTQEPMDDLPYDAKDRSRITAQEMPNTRMNSYVTNKYAGPHQKDKNIKHKGKIEGKSSEDEFGSDYGL